MSVLGILATIVRPAAEGDVDDKGFVTTTDWFLPEKAEIIWGGLAALAIFLLLVKFAGPAIKKGLSDRTAKIQQQLDAAAADETAAAADATQIRQALGDIAAERARILAEADAQAASVLEDGRSRLRQELADLEAKATSDIAASQGRVGDELRAEIARLSSAAVDHVVRGSLDDSTHQQLIESFITRVGASA